MRNREHTEVFRNGEEYNQQYASPQNAFHIKKHDLKSFGE